MSELHIALKEEIYSRSNTVETQVLEIKDTIEVNNQNRILNQNNKELSKLLKSLKNMLLLLTVLNKIYLD